MIEFMVQPLMISLMILFLHATTWDGMIFEKIKNVIKPTGMLYKPIYGCPICMTPWYGTLLYVIYMRGSWEDWFFTVGTASGLAVIWVVLLSLRDFAVEYTDKLEQEKLKKKKN